MHHSPFTIIDSLILRLHMECTAAAFNVYTCIYTYNYVYADEPVLRMIRTLFPRQSAPYLILTLN